MVATKTEKLIKSDHLPPFRRDNGDLMAAQNEPNHGIFAGEYVPYFYQAGLFQLYLKPKENDPVAGSFVPPNGYDFARDSALKREMVYPQTVEQIVTRGYFSVPQTEAETALISDKWHTSRLGLDDVIGQVRSRRAIYQQNIEDLEQSKCAAITSFFTHEAFHGPADAKVEYSLQKRLDELYGEQRSERIHLWRDVSKLKLLLPEQAQNYLTATRKVDILDDHQGDGL